MKTRVKQPTYPTLPLDIQHSDLSYPRCPRSYGFGKEYRAWADKNKIVHRIEMYDVINRGWVVATLHISNPGRRHAHNAAARTYGVELDGSVVRVGLGPHVKQVVTVYVTQQRLKALDKLVQLHTTGAIAANQIRDRISSRRAQGSIYRSQGRSSWMW